jgi:leucyl-tRNA synthetase
MVRLFNQGQILGPDGQRMSKSRGNVVAPDGEVERWGADTFRAYLMFLGPWDQGGPYDPSGITGIHRWLNRVWNVATAEVTTVMLAALMEYTNNLTRIRESGAPVDATAWTEAMESLALLLAPSVPHIAEELWQRLGRPYSVHTQAWPSHDPALATDDSVEIAVQVNGKVRDRLTLPLDASEDAALEQARASAAVRAHIDGKETVRVIYVPNRLLNIVVRG